MEILFNNKTIYEISEYENLINCILYKVIENEKINSNCEISITFVMNDEIKEINYKFRNVKKETDVLSFPFIDFEKGEEIPKIEKYLLGDIIISLEKAFYQANEYGHDILREVGFLVTHGMLHLLGYDHITLEDEKLMFYKQDKILCALGLKRE